MIISRTPYRISFFGGGTDYPAWFREHGGAVLSTTISHYCFISCRYLPPFFEHKSRIVWSELEQVSSTDEIKHPVVRELLNYMNVKEGVEIHHDGDLPARSGIGSSSAFAVGLLHALHALQGKIVTKRELAVEAIHVEQDLLKENVGVQDQIAAAHGGLNRIDILPNGDFEVTPLPVTNERADSLERHLLLFYTGVSRFASAVAKETIAAIPNKSTELQQLRDMVDVAVDILVNGNDITDFGRLLHEAWLLKRDLAGGVSPEFVNEIYAKARRAGAIGGKLLGAGGGGFMLLFVRPEDHQKVADALANLLIVPIELEQFGTQIIFHQRARRYSKMALHSRDFLR